MAQSDDDSLRARLDEVRAEQAKLCDEYEEQKRELRFKFEEMNRAIESRLRELNGRLLQKDLGFLATFIQRGLRQLIWELSEELSKTKQKIPQPSGAGINVVFQKWSNIQTRVATKLRAIEQRMHESEASEIAAVYEALCSSHVDLGTLETPECPTLEMELAALQSDQGDLQESEAKKVTDAAKRFLKSVLRLQVLLRDLLVMTICRGSGPWDKSRLREAIADAFARQGMKDKEMSQFMLAFSHIVELGKDWEEFRKKVCRPSIYGDDLTDGQVSQLFALYSHIAKMSPNYVSSPKASGKKRKPTSGARVGAHTAVQDHAQHSDGRDGSVDEGSSNGGGCNPPAEVSEQSSDGMVGQLRVKNTFIDFSSDDQEDYRREWQTLPDTFDRNLEGFAEGAAKALPDHMYQCFYCKRQCPEGWQRCRGKYHFCDECLLKGKKKAPSIPTSSSPGGPAVWEEEPDPISADPSRFRTAVDVVRGDCLEAVRQAHKADWSVGLLVFGIKEGPLIVHEQEGQGKRVIDQTTMRQAVRDTERPDRGVPKSGAIRVPQVALYEDPEIRFHTLYAASESLRKVKKEDGENEAVVMEAEKEAMENMRRKIKNLLRMSYKNGIDELILGAWGCGHHKLDPVGIAELFREALFEGDTANRIRKVVFAIKDPEMGPSHVEAFEQVFIRRVTFCFEDPQATSPSSTATSAKLSS